LLQSFINSVARAVPPLAARNSSSSALPSGDERLDAARQHQPGEAELGEHRVDLALAAPGRVSRRHERVGDAVAAPARVEGVRQPPRGGLAFGLLDEVGAACRLDLLHARLVGFPRGRLACLLGRLVLVAREHLP
jgi:hypothetical protein